MAAVEEEGPDFSGESEVPVHMMCYDMDKYTVEPLIEDTPNDVWRRLQ